MPEDITRDAPTTAGADLPGAGNAANLTTLLERAIGAIRALPGSSDDFRPGAVDAIRAAGLHLLVVPVDRGGLGAGMRESAAALAALGAEDASVALGLAMQTHVVGAAVESGAWPHAPFERLVAAAVADGALVNAASSEEGSGSPSRGGLPDTRAVQVDGGYRVSGEKTFTTWLPALRFALVSARLIDPATDGTSGGNQADEDIVIANLLVDLDSPGVRREAGFEALGMRGSASGRLVLRDVFVPSDMVVIRRRPSEPDPRGASGPAWFGMVLAAVYLGVGEGARAAVTRWAVDRRPGDGSSAVADLATVQVRLGRLDAILRAARIVMLDAAARWDAASPRERGAILPDIALAKVTATNAAVAATDEALRIAGGPGFVAGPLERAFRDARAGLINPPLDDIAYGGFARTLVDRERSGRRP
jgi:alkylation response protein AidB-like acyl-CoA dehydrogenase